MWYEFCLITDRSIVQVDHCSGQPVTDKDKMFTKTFTPRKHQAAQYNTTEHFSPVPFQSLACAVCILIPFNQSSFLDLFLFVFTAPFYRLPVLIQLKASARNTHQTISYLLLIPQSVQGQDFQCCVRNDKRTIRRSIPPLGVSVFSPRDYPKSFNPSRPDFLLNFTLWFCTFDFKFFTFPTYDIRHTQYEINLRLINPLF